MKEKSCQNEETKKKKGVSRAKTLFSQKKSLKKAVLIREILSRPYQ